VHSVETSSWPAQEILEASVRGHHVACNVDVALAHPHVCHTNVSWMHAMQS
jgi:hypothetical protein